jgi:hypothetical protein
MDISWGNVGINSCFLTINKWGRRYNDTMNNRDFFGVSRKC